MDLYSVKNPSLTTNFLDAAIQGLADDGGLWMPRSLPRLSDDFFANLPSTPFADMALRVLQAYIGDEIPTTDLEPLVRDAFTFDAPLARISERMYALELFHGPTLAFKDFGARFMARVMSYARRISATGDGDLCVLVATSGDTGSAVAHGFWNVPGIRVVILYPSGKVSDVQEKQLTTMGGNISAIELDGSFDDCQALVKRAFQDEELTRAVALTSANSINIARLLPQSLYYFRALAQLPPALWNEVVFCTPSGNFGNICAGLFARAMGLPAKKFLAASNRNDTFTRYWAGEEFAPRPSVETPSNAMDVGNPSNFDRIAALYNFDREALRRDVHAESVDDAETLNAVRRIEREHGYLMCPHTAVGYVALERLFRAPDMTTATGVVLATAHPAKFGSVIEPVLGKPVPMPERLQEYVRKEKRATFLPNDYDHVKKYLMNDGGR
jgi:threonine synthase